MKVKDAREMTLETFKSAMTDELLKRLAAMRLTPEHAHYILSDMLSDLEIEDDEVLGDMSEVVEKIIIDYTEELMLREFNRYELDWE